MAKRSRALTNAPASDSSPSQQPTTQRAYTLRLNRAPGKCDVCGLDECTCWREALWATHEAVNKGAKVFGDWLLTLRGGLSHELAEPRRPAEGRERTEEETAALRRDRRILLALSWLSVEDERGAPTGPLRVASGRDHESRRQEAVLAAFREILDRRGIDGDRAESWVEDCKGSLFSHIREDAVWVNRSAAFDAASMESNGSLTRDEVWDILEPFFGSPEAYFKGVQLDDDEPASEEKTKDLVQKAGQWLSSRFGTGRGADFSFMAKVYRHMADWARNAPPFESGSRAIQHLARSLKGFGLNTHDAEGILGLISGPGYKSATRNIISGWANREDEVSREDLERFRQAAEKNGNEADNKTTRKGPRPWSYKILAAVERACGFTYLHPTGPSRHSEFAVMLDHAARRVSMAHSWIKRAEASRRRFEADAARLRNVPSGAGQWLDAYVDERRAVAGGEYRIRPRAIEGWEQVLKRWQRCASEQDRIAAVRELQSDPEIEKFGDAGLFEALASDDAKCVWKDGDALTPDWLKDYVFGHDAEFRRRRFKVPAYRHPDALLHPVFCDFGTSRWTVNYGVHESVKRALSNQRRGGTAQDWAQHPRAIRIRLWDGNGLQDRVLRWSSKRLWKDLGIGHDDPLWQAMSVTRADRFGRSVSGVPINAAAAPLGLLTQKTWNARLQAPRRQLSTLAAQLARSAGKGNQRAKILRDRLNWLVTFSAALECRGPFIEYAKEHGITPNRKGEYFPNADQNKREQRKDRAKLVLSRLPGLRVLSVDLGHRFAAACAVWETLPAQEFENEITGRTIVAGGKGPKDLYCHTEHTDDKGKCHTTIYRRIGADTLADCSRHPAPWARLDRQFFIKLQGEDRPPRKASEGELGLVKRLRDEIGLRSEGQPPRSRRVDELMAEAVRLARLGLRRHGRAAKIAYAFNPQCPGIPGRGGELRAFNPGGDEHVGFLTDALADWHALATDAEWSGSAARRLWNDHIAPLPNGLRLEEPATQQTSTERSTRQQRREAEERVRKQLEPIARHLATRGRAEAEQIHDDWTRLWREQDGVGRTIEDFDHINVRNAEGSVIASRTMPRQGREHAGGWHARLRSLTDWIMGRRAPNADSEGWRRHVGGLSLTRIATMRSLYQLHKAFAMRPRPDNVRGAPQRGESNAGTAQSILDAMERMREQRVKQLASRIVEAALGIGRMRPAEGRDRRRPQSRVDEPCHAVVIENLRHYRPDELQTRRENRALMNWSAAKVRKYLEEKCQLHGLHLREVPASYTSRQDSRTGLPGVRCTDVPVSRESGMPAAPWWERSLADALREVGGGREGDAEARLLVDLERTLAQRRQSGLDPPASVRLPRVGGELFVAAPPQSCRREGHRPCPLCSGRRALQADLNAAANIGLRALLDPDFPGRWWYVLCDAETGQPVRDMYAGAAGITLDEPLLRRSEAARSAGGQHRRGSDKVNAWRDVGAIDGWRVHAAYWNHVYARVVATLRCANGLGAMTT